MCSFAHFALQGAVYFVCRENHGIMVDPARLRVLSKPVEGQHRSYWIRMLTFASAVTYPFCPLFLHAVADEKDSGTAVAGSSGEAALHASSQDGMFERVAYLYRDGLPPKISLIAFHFFRFLFPLLFFFPSSSRLHAFLQRRSTVCSESVASHQHN